MYQASQERYLTMKYNKCGNSGLKLLAPLVVHNEDNTYTEKVLEILNF